MYRATLALPLLAQATSAEDLRNQIRNMDLSDIIRAVEEGDWLSGTLTIASVEHIPADQVGGACEAYGSDEHFFGSNDLDNDDDDGDEDEGGTGKD